jgi:hypothetical protein
VEAGAAGARSGRLPGSGATKTGAGRSGFKRVSRT